MADELRLDGLGVRLGDRTLLEDVELSARAGEVTGLIGASGCGKSMTMRAIMGLVDGRPGIVSGMLEIRVGTHHHHPWTGLHGAPPSAWHRAYRSLRGRVLGYLPQDAPHALDPLLRVGAQVSLAARYGGHSPDPVPWLKRSGLPTPERMARLYPHQLSGGLAQRVVLAQTLAVGSRFILADEPTTGLDPTVAARIVDTLRALADEGAAVLIVTHDLRLLLRAATRITVLDGGRVVEHTDARHLEAGDTTHPTTRRLSDNVLRLGGR